MAAARPLGPDPMTTACRPCRWLLSRSRLVVSLMGCQWLWPLNGVKTAVGFAGKHGRVQAQKLPSPPQAGRTLFRHRCKPILPEYRANVLWWRLREGISCKERQGVGAVCEQTLLGKGHDRILSPVAERGKPEVPVEAWLVGRVDARRFVKRLRLVAEWIGGPDLAVV